MDHYSGGIEGNNPSDPLSYRSARVQPRQKLSLTMWFIQTVATSRKWLSRRHGVGHAALQQLGETERSERLENAGHTFFKLYIPCIQVALCESLPHLERLDWEDEISMPPTMYTALACSPVQHLELYRVGVNEEFEVSLPPSIATPRWSLRTLHLELFWNFPAPAKGSTSRLCASILRLCASTLELLTWVSPLGEPREIYFPGLEPPTFPVLRVLHLWSFAFADSSMLDALIGAPGAHCRLRTLSIDTEANEVHSRFFERRGAIPSLETFIWNTSKIPDTHSLAFLQSNTQLSKLSLTYETSPDFLDTRLLPLLSRSFTHLTSLDLSWAGPSISSATLQLLSTLTSLQQLQLSAGTQFGGRYDWIPNHDILRKHLSALPNLVKLALRRDTFRPDYDWIDVDSYYSIHAFRPRDAKEQVVADWIASRAADELRDVEENFRKQGWERVHRKRVLAEAEKYVRVMPRLEWLYFGQIPMGVVKSDSDSSEVGGKVIVPLFEKRDDCRTFLGKIFGPEAVG
jgi:hypothetical protein